MIRGITLWLFLVYCTLNIRAQINLVPNPSFEDADTCFDNIFYVINDTMPEGKVNQFRNPHDWFSAAYSTPDLIKQCTPNSIYTQYGFYQKPRTGNAMTHVYLPYVLDTTRIYSGKNGSEKLSIKLKDTLTRGVYYTIEYYLNLVRYPGLNGNIYASSSAAAHFSNYKFPFNYNHWVEPMIPQVINKLENYFTDTIGWQKFKGLYKANGGEEWLTIGFFAGRETMKWIIKDSSRISYTISDYFIDDVSLTYFDTSSHVIDTTLCIGRGILFAKRPYWDSCVWYDGSFDSSKVFTQSGIYWVTNFYEGYKVTDTLNVTFTDSLPIQVYFTGFCKGDSVLLTARKAQEYLWNNGSTNQQCYSAKADTFFVTGTTNGCKVTDTFYVQAYANPVIIGLKDTVVCFDDIEKVRLDGGEHYSYLWKPTGETTRTIYSTQAMLYTLTVTDTTLCKASTQVAVDEECAIGFYMPNAFSPNGDGINEEFKIVIPLGKLMYFEVYNRWGQLVESNTTGTWSGYQAQDGVYIIIVTYLDQTGQKQVAHGNVTLLR